MLKILAFFVLLMISWPLALMAALIYAVVCGVGFALKAAGAVAGIVFALLAVAFVIVAMVAAIPLALIF